MPSMIAPKIISKTLRNNFNNLIQLKVFTTALSKHWKKDALNHVEDPYPQAKPPV